MTTIVFNILKNNIGAITNRLELLMMLPLKKVFVHIQPKSVTNILKGIGNQRMNAR